MDLQPLATQLNRTEDHYLPSSHPFCVSHRYIEAIYGTPSDHREDIFTLIPYHPPSQWMKLHPQTCDSLFYRVLFFYPNSLPEGSANSWSEYNYPPYGGLS